MIDAISEWPSDVWDWVAALDYGDVPGWIAAITTALALIAAFIAARHTKDLLDREALRDDRAERQDIRRQAEQVSAWVSARRQYTDYGAFRQLTGVKFVCHVNNSSSQPVYEVTLNYVIGAKTVQDEDYFDVLPPLAEPAQRDLPGDAQGDLEVAMTEGEREGEELAPRVTIRFTDAAGRNWVREADGTLEQTGTSIKLAPNYDEWLVRGLDPSKFKYGVRRTNGAKAKP